MRRLDCASIRGVWSCRGRPWVAIPELVNHTVGSLSRMPLESACSVLSRLSVVRKAALILNVPGRMGQLLPANSELLCLYGASQTFSKPQYLSSTSFRHLTHFGVFVAYALPCQAKCIANVIDYVMVRQSYLVIVTG
jgi:hypothetical protein